MFAKPILISPSPGNSKAPVAVAAPDGALHVLWHDFAQDPAGLVHAQLRAGRWTASPLQLRPGKAAFATAVWADGLHLVWEGYGSSHELHATVWDGAWSGVQDLGAGRRAQLAVDDDGGVHAAFFADDDRPAHARLVGGRWIAGDPIDVRDEYVTIERVALVGADDGLHLAVCTSPGGTDFQVRRWRWRPNKGWGGQRHLHFRLFLRSAQPAGALGADGEPAWTWCEQDPEAPDQIGVLYKDTGELRSRWVARGAGCCSAPSLAFDPKGRAVIAWESPGAGIAVARTPFDEPQLMGGPGARRPHLSRARDGGLHLVFSMRDGAGREQIAWSHARA